MMPKIIVKSKRSRGTAIVLDPAIPKLAVLVWLLFPFSRDLYERSSPFSYYKWKLAVPPLRLEPFQIVRVVP